MASKIGKRDMVVQMVIKEQFSQVVGGWENNIMDKLADKLPSRESLAAEIYDEVMQANAIETPFGMVQVKRDIRFIGSDTIKVYIEELLTKKGY